MKSLNMNPTGYEHSLHYYFQDDSGVADIHYTHGDRSGSYCATSKELKRIAKFYADAAKQAEIDEKKWKKESES